MHLIKRFNLRFIEGIRLRFSILVVSLAVLLFIMLGLSADLAMAKLAPFHPGQALFPFQEVAEQSLFMMTQDPLARANYTLDLLQRRVSDLSLVQGTSEEDNALSLLSHELGQSIPAVAGTSAQGSSDLRNRLVVTLQSIQQVLDKLKIAPVQAAAQFNQLYNRLITLLAIVSNPANPLSALSGQPVAASQSPAPALPATAAGATPTPVEGDVAPIAILFPPGSKGALHEFFPLTGKHASLQCQDCHSQGVFAGTPAQCSACHTKDAPPNHYQAECDACHTTIGWKPASFNHKNIDSSDCASCHQKSEPANHFPGQCAECHSTSAWKPASFTHQSAAATDCASCHTQDKPSNHFTGQCSACHNTSAWKPATFNHQVAGATDCANCHTKDEPANHFTGQCSTCHNTSAWKPASFNHKAAGATDCVSCHTSNKPANHFTGQCSTCHNTSAWKPASFNHQAAGRDRLRQLPHQQQARQPLPRTVLGLPQYLRLEAGQLQPSGRRRPTAPAATPATSPPTTSPDSARPATTPPPGSRRISATLARRTAPAATPATSLPTTSPDSARPATTPPPGSRRISATLARRTASAAIPATSLPTTMPGSARPATTPPPGSRRQLQPHRSDGLHQLPHQQQACQPLTPGSARTATTPPPGSRRISATLA